MERDILNLTKQGLVAFFPGVLACAMLGMTYQADVDSDMGSVTSIARAMWLISLVLSFGAVVMNCAMVFSRVDQGYKVVREGYESSVKFVKRWATVMIRTSIFGATVFLFAGVGVFAAAHFSTTCLPLPSQ